jgi:hypothetical protein
MSSNNGNGKWTSPYHLFDYGMGELSKAAANPAALEAVFVTSVPPGKMQVVTMPKEALITAEDIQLTRWSIAFAYALGAHVLVPWDIYLPTPDAKRFFGNASDFADLYGFVRDRTDLFDGLERVGSSGSYLGGYKLAHTGAAGDGMRFRIPTDTVGNVTGNVTHGAITADVCAWSCDQSADCKGFFFSSHGECATLGKIIVTNTGLEGQSYTRGHSATRLGSKSVLEENSSSTTTTTKSSSRVCGAYTVCNSSTVSAIIRRKQQTPEHSAARNATHMHGDSVSKGETTPLQVVESTPSFGGGIPLVVVHLVDWAAAKYPRGGDQDHGKGEGEEEEEGGEEKEEEEGALSVTLSNVGVFGTRLNPTDCSWPGDQTDGSEGAVGSALKFSLFTPQDDGAPPRELSVVACLDGGNSTVLALPKGAIRLWALLKISA